MNGQRAEGAKAWGPGQVSSWDIHDATPHEVEAADVDDGIHGTSLTHGPEGDENVLEEIEVADAATASAAGGPLCKI